MLNTNDYPRLESFSLEAAKAYLLSNATQGDTHEIFVDAIADRLLQAARQHREAAAVLSGSNVRHYGGTDPDAPKTRVLYDAAWELVREGLIRPGPMHHGCLNPRDNAFCLTEAGRAHLAEASP